MRKKPLYLWLDLQLDTDSRREVASMCFYLGKSIEETRRIVDGFVPFEHREVQIMAPLAGYSPEEHQLCL